MADETTTAEQTAPVEGAASTAATTEQKPAAPKLTFVQTVASIIGKVQAYKKVALNADADGLAILKELAAQGVIDGAHLAEVELFLNTFGTILAYL